MAVSERFGTSLFVTAFVAGLPALIIVTKMIAG